ncbi:MAG: hypothetical protein U9R08_00295 [Nanoarchaeota archaeon]|nr:hypothetical protein [Nanoarchaeota archaeon]
MIRIGALLALQVSELIEHAHYLAEELKRLGYKPIVLSFNKKKHYTTEDLKQLKEDYVILSPNKITNHWKEYGYAEHFRERVDAHEEKIEEICQKYCKDECPDIRSGCILETKSIHQILEDYHGGKYEKRRILKLEEGTEELEMLLAA